MLEYQQEKKHDDDLLGAMRFVKKASQMRGLVFGNKIDALLSGGLAPNTLTFLYGKNADLLMNILCGNSIRIFGEQAIFIDAANSFDPYLIVEKCAPIKSEASARKFCERITIFRAFTCYQLRKLVSDKLGKEISKTGEPVRSVFVTGIDSMFNEEDNTADETEVLQLLIAQDLARIASGKKKNGMFVVASSKERVGSLFSKCDTAIELHSPSGQRATLAKHYSKQFAESEI